MYVVQSISQLEDAVRNGARGILIVGKMVFAVQEAVGTADSVITDLIKQYRMTSQQGEPKAPIILTRAEISTIDSYPC